MAHETPSFRPADDRLVAALAGLNATLRRRTALRVAAPLAAIALALSAVAQIVCTILVYVTEETIYHPTLPTLLSLWLLPLMPAGVAAVVVYRKDVSLDITARWADTLIGGNTVASALCASGPMREPVIERALSLLASMPAARPLALGRSALAAALSLAVGTMALALHLAYVPPDAAPPPEPRSLALGAIEAAASLLNQPAVADTARAFGLGETADAMEQARALGERLMQGGLADSSALAELGDIEQMLSSDQGMQALSELLSREDTRALLEQAATLLSGHRGQALDASALLGLLGENAATLAPLVEQAMSSPLLRSVLEGKASPEQAREIVDTRANTLRRIRELRRTIAPGTGENTAATTTVESSGRDIVTTQASGKNLTTIKRDAYTPSDRLAPQFRDAARDYLGRADR